MSFSFRGNNVIREAMHSSFLFHAIKAGMDMGIVNAGMIGIYEEIPGELLKLVEDVLFDRDAHATEALVHYAGTVKESKEKTEKIHEWRSGTLEGRIRHACIPRRM